MGKILLLICVVIVIITTSCNGASLPITPSQTRHTAYSPSPISTSTKLPDYTPVIDTPIPQTYTAIPQTNTLTLTATEYPSPTITPTSDYAKYANLWSTYTNEKFGFSFEYPAIYDEYPFTYCRVQESISEPWIYYLSFGYRSELAIANNDLPSFSDYVDRWAQSINLREDWSLGSRYGRVINGNQAVTIEYNFSIRWGITTFFGRKHEIYILNWTAGGSSYCHIPEIKVDHLVAYNHAVETFKFITPHP